MFLLGKFVYFYLTIFYILFQIGLTIPHIIWQYNMKQKHKHLWDNGGILKHTDFALKILKVMEERLGPISVAQMLREIYSQTVTFEMQADRAIEIVQMVAPRYKCDITLPLPRHNLDKLAEQLGQIFIIFARAHARNCPTCDANRAAAVILTRFINTYIIKVMFGTIPDGLPYRDQLFFLDEESDYVKPDFTDHGLTGDELRNAVKNWDITGKK